MCNVAAVGYQVRPGRSRSSRPIAGCSHCTGSPACGWLIQALHRALGRLPRRGFRRQHRQGARERRGSAATAGRGDRAPAGLAGRAAPGRSRRSSSGRRTARRPPPRSPRRLRPGGRRSRARRTTLWPSSRTASSARIVEPPVVTTSSTSMQRSLGSSSGPSIRRASPCCLASLRTKNAFTSAPPASAAQAIGSAPIVIPPTAVARQVARLSGDQLGERLRNPLAAGSRAWRRPGNERSRRWSARPRRSRAHARAAPPAARAWASC